MKLELVLPEAEVEYIRDVRRKVLETVDLEIRPELLEPSPFGMYLIARASEDSAPLGLVEFAFLDQCYSSLEEAYPEFNLSQWGAFEAFVGTRTIYVAPEARAHAQSYYLMLALAGALIAYDLGGRYTTVTTNASNTALKRLYERTGGQLLGTYEDTYYAESKIAVFVFDIEKLTKHPAARRLAGKVTVDPEVLRTVRSRRVVSLEQPQCA